MQPSVKRWALRSYAVAGTVLTIVLLFYAVPSMVDAWKQYPWDGKVDWIAARAFWDGRNPYSHEELMKVKLDGLGHPPTTSFWFLPFARWEMMQISPLVGHFVVFALLLMLLMLAYELRWPIAPLTAMLLFTLTLSSSWMYYHLYLVQVSGFIAFIYFLAWYLLRRGEDLFAGLLLGLACTFKLFPGLMVLMLLLGRRWRAVIAASCAYLCVFIVMTARFGVEAWPQYVATEKIITNYWIGNFHNASVYGIALRLLVPACKGAIVSQPEGTAISLAISAVLLALSFRLSWRSIQEGRWDLPFALFATLSVFMNPFTFEHYFVLEVFPAALAATALYHARRTGMSWRDFSVAATLLAGVVAMLAIPFRLKDDVSWKTHHMFRHFLEVTNWMHMPFLLAVLWILIFYSDRKGRIDLLPQPARL
jgi:hypothetical protein